jgi:phosphocarrier protein HPr
VQDHVQQEVCYQMIKKNITLCNKLGLHARASMKLINTAERFSSNITILYKNREVDATDIMALMALTAPCGTALEFCVKGDDENNAMTAIETLIINRFGENE